MIGEVIPPDTAMPMVAVESVPIPPRQWANLWQWVAARLLPYFPQPPEEILDLPTYTRQGGPLP